MAECHGQRGRLTMTQISFQKSRTQLCCLFWNLPELIPEKSGIDRDRHDEYNLFDEPSTLIETREVSKRIREGVPIRSATTPSLLRDVRDMPFNCMLYARSRSCQIDSHEALKPSRELAIEDLLRSLVSSKKEPLAVPARLSRNKTTQQRENPAANS